MMKIVMLRKSFGQNPKLAVCVCGNSFFRSFLFLIMMMGENVNIDAKYNLNSEGIHCYVHAK